MDKKKDYAKRIHILILVVGILLIIAGIISQLFTLSSLFSNILTTIGGVFSGLSSSWLIEEFYKKKDERYDANELYKKSLEIFEKSIECPDIFPQEADIKVFRNQNMHLYYLTRNESGKLFWNYTTLNFTQASLGKLRRLTSTAIIRNYKKNKDIEYEVEMFRKFPSDRIILISRKKGTRDPIYIAVFEPYSNTSKETICGFALHDDWTNEWRLSPAVLSFSSKFPKQKAGPLSNENAKWMQNLWNEMYKNKDIKSVFDEYVDINQ
ncbi:MAG: hypothetical protein BGO31_16915 [Bacteroidetes bacterium 43-16]|uniref:hypothetical protein n=1 Tax=uncultured Flavobacterium sp. TaxID=165435 RepID=UPI00092CBD5D|nr:hypothetical protein [uncultured Flavobacterium sp.]OJV55776.1 MAG: hypothetical protein BGO31_16915 [Bacteroidetes bacterium 43-16]